MILYSYNGIVAGALPEYDTALYPNAIIVKNAATDALCALFISDQPFTYDGASGAILAAEGAALLRAVYYNDGWGGFAEYEGTELPAAQWTNTPILYSSEEDTTNYADPASSDWLTDYRLYMDATPLACAGAIVTNYIAVQPGDLVRVKGLAVAADAMTTYPNTPKQAAFDANKNYLFVNRVQSGNVYWTYADEDGVPAVTITGSDVAYMRFTGELLEGYTAQTVEITRQRASTEVYLESKMPTVYDPPLIITHDVTVDMMVPGMPSVVHAVQDDQYSRDLRLTILCGGVPWEVPASAKVTVRYLKPDKTGGNYDTMPDGSYAATIEGNRVTVKLAPQVLTVAGNVLLCIRIESGSTKINTFYAKIDVQANPGITAASTNFFKLTGTLADAGWAPNMILGTDENGNVIAVENPADRMEELVAGINAALDELIGEEGAE